MKLHALIFASSLVITGSMYGMDQIGEKTPLNAPTNNQIFSGRTDEMVATFHPGQVYRDGGEWPVTEPLPKAQPLPDDCHPAGGLKVDQIVVAPNEQRMRFKKQQDELKTTMKIRSWIKCLCCPCIAIADLCE